MAKKQYLDPAGLKEYNEGIDKKYAKIVEMVDEKPAGSDTNIGKIYIVPKKTYCYMYTMIGGLVRFKPHISLSPGNTVIFKAGGTSTSYSGGIAVYNATSGTQLAYSSGKTVSYKNDGTSSVIVECGVPNDEVTVTAQTYAANKAGYDAYIVVKRPDNTTKWVKPLIDDGRLEVTHFLNATDTIDAEFGKYYVPSDPNTNNVALTVNLPPTSTSEPDRLREREFKIFIKSGSSSPITFISPTNDTIFKSSFTFTSGSRYEISCRWNGAFWQLVKSSVYSVYS